jgi:large subunit ribosomal protein L25
MTQADMTMTIEARKPGKGPSIAYRKERKVPAVIYGPKTKNMNCLIDEIFVLKHSGSRHESSIFQTQCEQGDLNNLKVMLKNIDTHPATQRPVHVDLYALDMTAKIKVNVNIEFVGTPKGEGEGGVLQTVLRDVEIECNPVDIPESIQVDVSELAVNDSIHVSDIQFPAGITPVTAPERTVCNVSIPKEEPAEEPVEVAAEGAEAPPAGDPADAKADESKDS